MNQKRLLFLCTGNYYRSRFAEEYFNHVARETTLAWQAESRGLAERPHPGNFGPISIYALQYLQLYRVEPDFIRRYPLPVEEADFDRFDRIVALSREEHEPMLQRRFPNLSRAIEYFEIGDTHITEPAQAIPRLVHRLDELIAALRPDDSS